LLVDCLGPGGREPVLPGAELVPGLKPPEQGTQLPSLARCGRSRPALGSLGVRMP